MSQVKDEFFHSNRNNNDEKKAQHFAALEAIINASGFSLKDILEHFPSFVQRRNLPKFLAHYELFKKVQHLPGSIAELGVYRGAGFFAFAKLLETFSPSDRTRKVYGFDHFQGLRKHNQRFDGDLTPWLDNVLGDLSSDASIMQALTDLHNEDNFVRGDKRCILVNGDICETVPQFVNQHPGLRLSMLYFDVGLYQPTLTGLTELYPLVVPGGLVVFNGYGMQPWEGEAQAVEEYFADASLPALQKFEFSPNPQAYFVKP